MGAQAAQEPSMEEILASIRRIISKDDSSVAGSDSGAGNSGVRQRVNSSSVPASSFPREDGSVVRPLSFSGSPGSSVKTSGEMAPVHEFFNSSIREKEFNSDVFSPEEEMMKRKESSPDQNALENGKKRSSDLNSQFIDSRDEKKNQVDPGLMQKLPVMDIPENRNFPDKEVNVRNKRDSIFSGENCLPVNDGGEKSMEFGKELVSSRTNESVSTSFRQLKNLAIDDIDDKVIRLLKPMLREWLDDNLPVMVERLVRSEIERVSRSG